MSKIKWKLSEHQKREITIRYKNGDLLRKIALDFNISLAGVYKIAIVRGAKRRRTMYA